MPGIAGIVSTGERIDNPAQILNISKTVHSLRGVNFIYRTLQTDYCLITNVLTGLLKTSINQPVSDFRGNTFLFLEGDIFNREDLQNCLDESNNISLCDLLLALFLKYGTDFISRLNGEFNIVIYQKNEKCLTILNDHMASQPMYYMEENGQLIFGSEKKSILALSKNNPAVDPVGLLQNFAHVHNLGDRTYIQGINRLTPGSVLVYQNGKPSISQHQFFGFRVPEVTPRIETLIDKWCNCLRKVTARRLKGKQRVLIFLSAGLDSRAIGYIYWEDLA